MTTIAYVRQKLVAAQKCHPNAVQTLIEEALEAIDSIALHETPKTAKHGRSDPTQGDEPKLLWEAYPGDEPVIHNALVQILGGATK